MGVTTSVPEVGFVPDQPPIAVQLVAPVELHDNVEDCPWIIDNGHAENVRVTVWGGALATVIVTLFPPVYGVFVYGLIRFPIHSST